MACELIRKERSRFIKNLQQISFLEVFPSEANYFLCEVKAKFTDTEITELLIDKNFYIKDLTGKIGFEGKEYVRIAVRDSEDNDSLMLALKGMD